MKANRGLITFALLAFAGAALGQTNANRVAMVNGQVISQEDLEKAAANELKNLEVRRLQNESAIAQDKQQILTNALEELAAEKLIEADAAKQIKRKRSFSKPKSTAMWTRRRMSRSKRSTRRTKSAFRSQKNRRCLK